MCHAVKCFTCGKKTWAGCGRDIDQVMARVPEAAQRTCRRPAAASDPSAPGWPRRLMDAARRS